MDLGKIDNKSNKKPEIELGKIDSKIVEKKNIDLGRIYDSTKIDIIKDDEKED